MPEQIIGYTDDRERVSVEISLTTHSGRTFETVNHDSVTSVTRLSIVGNLYGPHCRNPWACGQIRNDVRRVTRPSKGWTLEDIARLADIWEHWHLNDMRAACAHMSLPTDTSYDARQHITCPRVRLVKNQKHYRYGHAWLVESLPIDVLADVQRFITK